MSEPTVPIRETPSPEPPRNWLLEGIIDAEILTAGATRTWEGMSQDQRDVIKAMADRAYPGQSERDLYDRQKFIHGYILITKLTPLYLEQVQEVRELEAHIRLGSAALDTPTPHESES